MFLMGIQTWMVTGQTFCILLFNMKVASIFDKAVTVAASMIISLAGARVTVVCSIYLSFPGNLKGSLLLLLPGFVSTKWKLIGY